jgi:hypothetical protein
LLAAPLFRELPFIISNERESQFDLPVKNLPAANIASQLLCFYKTDNTVQALPLSPRGRGWRRSSKAR